MNLIDNLKLKMTKESYTNDEFLNLVATAIIEDSADVNEAVTCEAKDDFSPVHPACKICGNYPCSCK